MRKTKTVLERLAARSRTDGECLVWTGSGLPAGHGRIQIAGKNMLVHRVAWLELVGPIPAELPHVLHHCDNPPCFRVDHLFLGTHADNMADMARKGRASRHGALKTHCVHGHEYTAENTAFNAQTGGRYCRTCNRLHQRALRAAMVAA